MNDTQLETLDQVRQFLEGSEAISFQIESKDVRYRWIQHTLVKFPAIAQIKPVTFERMLEWCFAYASSSPYMFMRTSVSVDIVWSLSRLCVAA